MKDEELAQESWFSEDNGYRIMTNEATYIYAFKKGLKAGRPKWHDLRKNPEDLPESGVQVLSENGDVVIYNGDRFCWFEYSPNADNIRLRNWEKPVAWCEKPEFKE